MFRQFTRIRHEAIEQSNRVNANQVLLPEVVDRLPIPIQRHFMQCGFIGRPVAWCADIVWEESFIKLKPDQAWRRLRTRQFNAVNPIVRTAHMKVKSMWFAGMDSYRSGVGIMKGKIANLFTVLHARGDEVSQSALVTSFCEMMLLSGYAIQPYIQWTKVDDQHVRAKLNDGGIVVGGDFYFDDNGLFRYFETNERYFDRGGGKFEQKRFVAQVNSYKKVNNYFQPAEVSVMWYLDEKPFEYFKGTIDVIYYNPVA